MFVYFKELRETQESFGDFCNRVGFDAIREYVANYKPKTDVSGESGESDGLAEAVKSNTSIPKKLRHRVTVRDDVYSKLKQASVEQGKPMTDMVNEALKAYLEVE